MDTAALFIQTHLRKYSSAWKVFTGKTDLIWVKTIKFVFQVFLEIHVTGHIQWWFGGLNFYVLTLFLNVDYEFFR